jgi:hypothetical protein
MSDPFQQDGGCLTVRGLELLRKGGSVPPEVMTHLASCPSCQRRALEVDVPRGNAKRSPPPDLRRMLVYVAVIFVAGLLALYSMIKYH